MEDDPKLQALAALTVIAALVILVIQFSGRRSAPTASSGPGWYSRLNPFGVAPSAAPAPAASREVPDLAPPEPMMTKAVTRQFSSPSSGVTGGIAGVQAPADAANTAMTPPRLNAASVNIPGGGRAPVSAGSASRGPGVSADPASSGGSYGAGSSASGPAKAASAGGRATRPRGGGGPVASGAPPLSGTGTTGSSASAADGGAADINSSTPPPGEELKVPDKMSGGDFLGSGRGGSMGGDAGGGGGGGGEGGLGGGLPGGAKPKSSAGKPEGSGADTAASGPAAVPKGPGGPSAPSGDIVSASAVIGTPQVGTTTANGGMFRLHPGGPLEVPTVVHTTRTGAQLVVFQAKMAIDADGAGGAWRHDATGQSKTSLLYKNGDSLNPQTIPFIVVPLDFHLTHPRVGLGDYAAVTYGAKTLYAIVGDKGPRGVLGEGSMSLAASLGINPDPNKGGITRKDVRYAIIPGTRDPEPPRDGAAVQSRGRAIFEAAGAPVR